MKEPRDLQAAEMAMLEKRLAEMAVTGDEAEAFLASLASAMFPGGPPERGQVTWPEHGRHAAPGANGEAGGAEARLKAAEARFRTLVEQIPAVTFLAVLGEGKNEVYVSPHIEQMLGFSQQEWLEAPFLWYWQLHPDDRELWNQEFARGLRTGGPFKAECRFIARDGHVVWVHGEAKLVKDDLGRPSLLQGIAFDITESKRAQELLVHQATREAKLQEELAIAHRVQTAILPKRFDLEGLEVAATMIPATEVGGDYYDVQQTSDGAWLAIGDVSGHGLDAGLVMLMVQSAISAIIRARPDATPRDVLVGVNEVLFDNIRSRLHHDDHVTLSLFRYSRDGQLVFAGAHEEILVRRARTGTVESMSTPGTWLGGMRDISRVTVDSRIQLEEGDVVFLYTDGLTEAMNAEGELFDIDRVRSLLAEAGNAPCEQIRDRILDAARDWMSEQQDDVSLLVLRHLGQDRPRRPAAAPSRPSPAPGAVGRFAVASLIEDKARVAVGVPELELKAQALGRLSARGWSAADALGLKLSGLAEHADLETLANLLAAFHQTARERRAGVVELDLREVRFMTSSSFKQLVTWMANVNALPAGQRYRVRFVADPLVRWQRSGVAALAAFAPDLVLTA